MGPGAARLARDMQEHGPIDVHLLRYATLRMHQTATARMRRPCLALCYRAA